ncbi:penicillin-binding protein 2 [Nocardioides sp. Kera G14]|uniref:penicillin-binding protein 2 n=1 Tax=Nocardioides sp. Kera G14 TaxID=2884264 RepID=UPI001D1196E4|nr:penicillin-binding protein 2 [Nocardioides sp. Kera G14]UDY24495.1 penicillin-binding protein 2 [Nocardioides sp. Kera G14]
MADSSRTSRTSRLRLIVLQALVFSLFATLLVRLWWLQVDQGPTYRAKASSQSVRDVTVQPARGLIVDDMGRPLVTNRKAWVVSIDKNTLAQLDSADRAELLKRVTKATGVKVAEIQKDLDDWNGSRYEPVPIASDVPEKVALAILEQPEDYPGVVADQQSVRAYPQPYGINLAHVLGYLSPVTDKEYAAATKANDPSINATSSVGRAGVEKEYDEWLRGLPGETSVPVDSLGRPTGVGSTTAAQAGDTLVTSIDAKVQASVEKQLNDAITTARATYDPVTHKNYVADSGAAIVMEAKTGRIVAMASQPTYDPSVWVGGITQKQLTDLTSEKSGDPLLPRATQGQFAPGSTWKPIMTTGAISGGMSTDTTLGCSSGLQIGNRWFKNYESESYGNITFARALEVSCDTFFYRVGLNFWNKYGSDPANAKAKDPLGAAARSFGFGKPTGVDLPGEASGRVGDRIWRNAYFQQTRQTYCDLDEKIKAGKAKDTSAFMKVYAHEFCLEGNYFRQGDAANFTIGQGDTMVTPLQLARAYAAISNGGKLYEPTVGKAIVSEDGTVLKEIKPTLVRHVKVSKKSIDYVNNALLGTPKVGTLAWKFHDIDLDKVHIRGKTGSAEVENKQSTSWVATYDKNYVVLMMVTQGGTGSGTAGVPVENIWKTLYGIQDDGSPKASKTAIPGLTPPKALPTFAKDGAILPPVSTAKDSK